MLILNENISVMCLIYGCYFSLYNFLCVSVIDLLPFFFRYVLDKWRPFAVMGIVMSAGVRYSKYITEINYLFCVL